MSVAAARTVTKSWAVKTLLRGTGAILRSRHLNWAKPFCWSHVCIPHLSWREVEIICQTTGGDRFYARPSDFVENRICFFGVWEPAITTLFTELTRPGDVVIDAGANIGYYSVLSSRLVGSRGRVFCLEPSVTIRGRLERNLSLNACENVTVIPCGAWHESGHASLNLVSGNEGSSTLSTLSDTGRCESVRLDQLDRLIPTEFHERIRWLKIDVEGAEWSALRGATRLLERSPGIAVLCEVTPDRLENLGGSVKAVLEFMQQRGFRCYRLTNDYSCEAYFRGNQRPGLRACDEAPKVAADLLFTRELAPELQPFLEA